MFSLRPKLYLNNQLLHYKNYLKYLGYILDPEIASHAHIKHTVNKARNRLKIMKYISGTYWGAHASTRRTSHTYLIGPIIEYG